MHSLLASPGPVGVDTVRATFSAMDISVPDVVLPNIVNQINVAKSIPIGAAPIASAVSRPIQDVIAPMRNLATAGVPLTDTHITNNDATTHALLSSRLRRLADVEDRPLTPRSLRALRAVLREHIPGRIPRARV